MFIGHIIPQFVTLEFVLRHEGHSRDAMEWCPTSFLANGIYSECTGLAGTYTERGNFCSMEEELRSQLHVHAGWPPSRPSPQWLCVAATNQNAKKKHADARESQ